MKKKKASARAKKRDVPASPAKKEDSRPSGRPSPACARRPTRPASASPAREPPAALPKRNPLPARLVALPWPLPSPLPSLFGARLEDAAGGHSLDFTLESAQQPLARMRGLMFRQKCAALLFSFDWSDRHAIHSFFVAFPFDALYLDEQGRVADAFESVPPFSAPFSPRAPARYLLELPPGSIRKLSLRPGRLLRIFMRY